MRQCSAIDFGVLQGRRVTRNCRVTHLMIKNKSQFWSQQLKL